MRNRTENECQLCQRWLLRINCSSIKDDFRIFSIISLISRICAGISAAESFHLTVLKIKYKYYMNRLFFDLVSLEKLKRNGNNNFVLLNASICDKLFEQNSDIGFKINRHRAVRKMASIACWLYSCQCFLTERNHTCRVQLSTRISRTLQCNVNSRMDKSFALNTGVYIHRRVFINRVFDTCADINGQFYVSSLLSQQSPIKRNFSAVCICADTSTQFQSQQKMVSKK